MMSCVSTQDKAKCIGESRIRISELPEFLSMKSKADQSHSLINSFQNMQFRRRVIFNRAV